MPAGQAERLVSAARTELRDCSRVVIFDATGTILHSTFEVSQVALCGYMK